MKLVTIKSITDCTITFSKINLILRGNCNNLTLYPTSYARHVKIETEEQEKEILSLQKLNLIEIIVEEDTSPKPAPKQAETDSQESNTQESKPQDEKKKVADSKSKKVKKVSRKDSDQPIQDQPIQDQEELNKEDITDESILAAIKLDEERAAENIVENESPNESEKSNGIAVISVGNKTVIRAKMQRCVVEGSDEVDQHAPFIDDPAVIKKLDNAAKEAFIDENKDQDDTSDAFVDV